MTRLAVILGLAVAAFAGPGCDRRRAVDPGDPVERLMRNQVETLEGRSLNGFSPDTRARIVPRLRVGMRLLELTNLLTKGRYDPAGGRSAGTMQLGRVPCILKDGDGHPLLDDAGEIRADPECSTLTFYLKDADLVVEVDASDRIRGWAFRPISPMPTGRLRAPRPPRTPTPDPPATP